MLNQIVSALLVCTLCVSTAGSAIIRVEKNGSADYATIVEALQFATSGDTVAIGVGRFDDTIVAETPGYVVDVRILVEQSELTVLGAGRDQTIIGPESPLEPESFGNVGRGLLAASYFGAQKVWVEGIGFENLDIGLNSESCSIVYSNCRFSGNYYASYSTGGSSAIRDCRFDSPAWRTSMAISHGQSSLRVEGSYFLISETPGGPASGLEVQSTDTVVENCTFEEGQIGMSVAGSYNNEVDQCQFIGQTSIGFAAQGQSGGVIRRSSFNDQSSAIYSDIEVNLLVQDVGFENVSIACVHFLKSNGLSVHGCSFDPNAEYVVKAVESLYPASPGSIDCTENYWGTNDPAEIEELIYDHNDNPDNIGETVLYDPYLEVDPLPAESRSLGTVKSWFR